ncbi:TlpA family protein disulfide reductase [Saccharicrinis sp. FJH62]|uniref:TlpA family protein disulfide reductase n=1 Tax=Saccharicrinis sp. FJH62 TaxID=3344657 RepID=UPI0035D40F14
MKKILILFVILFITSVSCSPSGKTVKIPESIHGNYFDINADDFWVYSIQEDFVISDCKFWEIKKVVDKKKFIKLVLVNNNTQKNLVVSKISDNAFQFKDNNASRICKTSNDRSGRIARNLPFTLQPGSVTILGFIKNYEKYKTENPVIEFTYNNYVLTKENSEYAKIDSLGRFALRMELLSAQDIMYKFKNELHNLFVSPGDSIMLYFDPDGEENTNYQGGHSDVCYDMQETYNTRCKLNNARENNRQYGKPFNEYKLYRETVRNNELDYLQQYSEKPYCTEIFKIWYDKTSYLDNIMELLKCNLKYHNLGDKNSEKRAFDNFVSKFKAEVNMNDTLAALSGLYFFYTLSVSELLYDFRNAYKEAHLQNKKYISENESLNNNEKLKLQDKTAYKIMANNVLSMSPGRFRDIVCSNLVAKVLDYRQTDNVEYVYTLVKDKIDYIPYLDMLTGHINDFQGKEKALTAFPVNQWQSGESGEVLLKSIINTDKGKNIILDFWFTGCGACRTGFKAINAFKKEVESEANVVFVYLCFNSSEKDWKFVSNEFDLLDRNYLLNSDQTAFFKKNFSLSGAPRYILINSDGKIVDDNFKFPKEKAQFVHDLKSSLQLD